MPKSALKRPGTSGSPEETLATCGYIISLLVLPSLMLAITPTGLHRSRNAGCSKEQRHWHQS